MGNAAIKRLPSATGPDVEPDPYKGVRRALIEVAYNEQNKSRGRNKEAVRMMLGPLTAARKNGETFEELAALMTRHGYPMAGSTLRNYYFELRADAELKALVREQADVLSESRRRLVTETSQAKIQAEAAAELASRRKRSGLVSRPKLVSAKEMEGGSQSPFAGDIEEDRASAQRGPIRQQQTTSNANPGSPAPIQKLQGGGERKEGKAVAGASTAIPPRKPATLEPADRGEEKLTPGKAPSIALLKKMAASVTEKVALPMDVELKDGVHAYYADGSPLDLVLTLRQVRLLESSGRLIATGKPGESGSRTADNFVKLPTKL